MSKSPESPALRSFVQIAAKSHLPPFVLDIPRHTAPSTNVVEGLGAAVRRVWCEWQVAARMPQLERQWELGLLSPIHCISARARPEHTLLLSVNPIEREAAGSAAQVQGHCL